MLCGPNGFGQGPGCLSLFKQAEAHCKVLSWGRAKSAAKPGRPQYPRYRAESFVFPPSLCQDPTEAMIQVVLARALSKIEN